MGGSCIWLNSLESIFHRPGLNYYKPDRNYFIRSQRPQGWKCPMNKKLFARSGSTAPFHHVSWIFESTNQRSSERRAFSGNFLCGAATRGENENGFNATKVFNVHSLMWARAILCFISSTPSSSTLKGEKSNCVSPQFAQKAPLDATNLPVWFKWLYIDHCHRV